MKYTVAGALCIAALAWAWQSPPTPVPPHDTSTPSIMPAWAMEPWWWEDDLNTVDAVWDLVNGARQHNLPIGAVMIDSPWATAYNNFVFDEKRYPNPRGLIEQWHKMGIRTVLWMANTVNLKDEKSDAPGSDEDLYTFGQAHRYFVNPQDPPLKWWKGRGGMIDYTNPEAVEWWHRLMDRALQLGIDGWKVDGTAEMFYLTKRQTSRGVINFEEYLDLYYRDSLHYGQRYKPDFVTMVRSVDIANSGGLDVRHAPLDAAPLTWTGDQRHSWTDKGLDEAVRSFSRALDLGYPVVSSDTGGYQSARNVKPGEEKMPRLLFLRWAQWNAMTPFFVNGGHNEHRPWKFDDAFFKTFQRYLWLHHELVPFYYSQSVQASLREGQLLHPGPRADEYLIGDAFLVGIMTNEKPEREMEFPGGEWIDYWDNRTIHKGGSSVRIAVPESRSPVFVRRGSLVAMNVENNLVGHGDAQSKGWLTLDIYPDDKPSDAVVWDTTSFPPRAGVDRTRIRCEPTANGYTINLDGGVPRDTILRVWSPSRASVSGLPNTSLPNTSLPNTSWRYDASDQRLWIRIAKAHNMRIHVQKR